MKMTLTIGAALIAAALIWALRSHRAPPATADGQVIEQLLKAGSDLSKPHNIEFFLYFPTEDAARAAASGLNDPSFAAVISKAAKGPGCLLQLTRSMRPVEPELVRLRSTLDALAAKHGGVYDGWGTPIVSGT